MMSGKQRRLVMGGGLAGVAAALWCREAMEGEVVLLEKEASLCQSLSRLGGKRVVLGRLDGPEDGTEAGVDGFARLLAQRWPGRLNYDWLKELRCDLWVDEAGVFGASGADSLRETLTAALAKASIEVRTGFTLDSLGKSGNTHTIWSREGQREEGQALLMATGGQRNHALRLIAELGHTVNETGPGYLRLKPASRPFLQELSPWEGTAGLKHPATGDLALGELRISGRGLEGVGVSELSSRLAKRWQAMQYRFRLEVDFLPAMREAEVREALSQAVQRAKRRPLSAACPFSFTGRFWEGALRLSKVDPTESAQSVKPRRVEALAHRLKAFPVAIEGMGLPAEERAFHGGIDAYSLYPERLESRHVPRLYFAGEVLDVLGSPNGGHLNLMFASAHLAGTALAE